MKISETMKEEILRDAPYGSVLEYQREVFGRMVEQRRDGLPLVGERILYVEHQPVYTLGRHAKASNIIHPEWLAQRGAEVFEIERGGDVTFHGPGQLVVYPIVDLQSRRLGVKQYVNLLEESVVRTIAEYGIRGERVDGATGVWIDPDTPRARKICAIGIKCSRFIAMHGLALNVSTDLSWFSAINPCGFTDKGVTSVAAETGRADAQLWEEVQQKLSKHLWELL